MRPYKVRATFLAPAEKAARILFKSGLTFGRRSPVNGRVLWRGVFYDSRYIKIRSAAHAGLAHNAGKVSRPAQRFDGSPYSLYRGTKAHCGKTSPLRMVFLTLRAARMSSKGLPSTATRSANLPGSIVPRSAAAPKASAALTVAVCSA